MTRIGYIVGSTSKRSINATVAQALVALAPAGVELVKLDWSELPIYTYDTDGDFPAAGRAWKDAIESVDGIIILTPEYLRSVPGGLKNALDWASRPWGTNSFNGKPVAIGGVSVGAIGTATAQQHLRAILAHLNAPTMGQPELFLKFSPEVFPGNGTVTDDSMVGLLSGYLDAVVAHVQLHTHALAAA